LHGSDLDPSDKLDAQKWRDTLENWMDKRRKSAKWKNCIPAIFGDVGDEVNRITHSTGTQHLSISEPGAHVAKRRFLVKQIWQTQKTKTVEPMLMTMAEHQRDVDFSQ
jgi:hypothetical protein